MYQICNFLTFRPDESAGANSAAAEMKEEHNCVSSGKVQIPLLTTLLHTRPFGWWIDPYLTHTSGSAWSDHPFGTTFNSTLYFILTATPDLYLYPGY